MSDWEQHAEGVFSRRYRSLNLNVGVVECGDGLLVIDTRASHAQARELKADIAELSSRPVRWVVNTHHHWDHTFGNHEFGPVPIWGHERCRETLLEGGERMRAAVKQWVPDHSEVFDEVVITPPDHTFRTEATLTLGERTVAFRHLGLGHTDNDIVILTSGVVFAGDLVEEGASPAFQDSYPLDWAATETALLDLIEGPVVPGHGRVVDRVFVAGQRDELAEVKHLATQRHLEGMDPETAAAAGGPYPAEALLPAFQRAWRHLAERE
jgi:glyoxylase-like metal-dependent hydrolase (beta-lactamase superfamily II)